MHICTKCGHPVGEFTANVYHGLHKDCADATKQPPLDPDDAEFEEWADMSRKEGRRVRDTRPDVHGADERPRGH